MREFYARGLLLKNLGASFIALIPKKNGADKIQDFRPISLLGSVYKILTKVLAGRIQKALLTIISPHQGAFTQGRQILDVLVANECVHSKFRNRSSGLLCKLDLEKAYDRVDWRFLTYMLRRTGFGDK